MSASRVLKTTGIPPLVLPCGHCRRNHSLSSLSLLFMDILHSAPPLPIDELVRETSYRVA